MKKDMVDTVREQEERQNMKSKSLKVILQIIAITVFMLCICSCSGKSDKVSLEEFESKAEKYYKEKYGEIPEITESGYIYIEGVFRNQTDDMYIKTASGDVILYIEEKNQIYDNRQAEEINSELENTVLSRVIEESFGNMGSWNTVQRKVEFNGYDRDNLSGSFYHGYYDGDIEAYLESEEIDISADIYLTCAREDSWREARDAFAKNLKKTFENYEHSSVKLIVLSEECYGKYVDGVYRTPDIDMEECYARYLFGENEQEYIQNYIEAGDGIYVTSAEPDFVLEEGDITLEENITVEELNQLLRDKFYEQRSDADGQPTVVAAVTPIYQMHFSERVREKIDSKNYKELSVYIKYAPQTASETDEKNEGTEMSGMGAIEGVIEGAVGETVGDTAGETNEESGIYLYYYKNSGTKNYYRCFDLYSDMSEAEFSNINEEDYYFVGKAE